MRTKERVLEAYERLGGASIAEIARDLKLARSTVQYHVEKLGLKPLAAGRVSAPEAKKSKPLRKGEVRRYILTSAQNNTPVHAKVWESLTALASHHNAEIMVGTFTYNQNQFGKLSVKRNRKHEYQRELWYDAKIEPHIVDEPIELAPGLEWRGEMNILPTAINPLTGFETYTHRRSGIFPHAKFAMRSIASGSKHEPTKFNYTTGCCTQRNYVQKRAGMRAEHHHGYGGLIVEVDSEGRWFVRQLHCDEDGTMFDLDLVVEDGVVYESDEVECITWGDIHQLLLDRDVEALAWGEGGMLNSLRPRVQVFHDLLLGAVTNHWESSNPHERFRRHVKGGGWASLQAELGQAAEFLESASRPWCISVVADSNHDRAWIERWLRQSDYRNDPKNAILFLRLQLATYEAISADPDNRSFHILEHALHSLGLAADAALFLREDDPYTVADGKIEVGTHGHLGPNGSRGHPELLSKVGRRMNTAHTHAAGIYDGLYVAGTSCKLDMGYNRGPSSWSHSHVVTYPNGKRAIVTMWRGRWRA